MTNNTIHNVPRELLAELQEHIHCHHDAVLWGKVCDLLSTPSPAGVDGLNTDRNAAFKACPESGCDWGSFYLGWKARGEVEQAIIDGLRAEIGAQRVKTCIALKERNDAREERDQQAQRIGELERALLEVAASLAWNAHGECRAIHDGPIMPSQIAIDVAKAALSAGIPTVTP